MMNVCIPVFRIVDDVPNKATTKKTHENDGSGDLRALWKTLFFVRI